MLHVNKKGMKPQVICFNSHTKHSLEKFRICFFNGEIALIPLSDIPTRHEGDPEDRNEQAFLLPFLGF